MKATNLHQLSRELRTSLISEFNLKDLTVKIEVFSGRSGSININIGDKFHKRAVMNYIKEKDYRFMLENGTTKKFKYIFILKK